MEIFPNNAFCSSLIACDVMSIHPGPHLILSSCLSCLVILVFQEKWWGWKTAKQTSLSWGQVFYDLYGSFMAPVDSKLTQDSWPFLVIQTFPSCPSSQEPAGFLKTKYCHFNPVSLAILGHSSYCLVCLDLAQTNQTTFPLFFEQHNPLCTEQLLGQSI